MINLINNIINPLIGEERQNYPNLYVILHLVIDVICFLLCFISVHSIATIGQWTKKENINFIIDGLRHILLPIFLLCIPLVTDTPIRILWLFVKDLCLLLYLNAGILIIVGVYKIVFLLRKLYIKNHCLES